VYVTRALRGCFRGGLMYMSLTVQENLNAVGMPSFTWMSNMQRNFYPSYALIQFETLIGALKGTHVSCPNNNKLNVRQRNEQPNDCKVNQRPFATEQTDGRKSRHTPTAQTTNERDFKQQRHQRQEQRLLKNDYIFNAIKNWPSYYTFSRIRRMWLIFNVVVL